MDHQFLHCSFVCTDASSRLNNVRRLPDGRLITFAVMGKANAYSHFTTEPVTQLLMCRVSEDEGRSWHFTSLVYELPAPERLNILGDFLISRSGKIHLFLYRIASISFEDFTKNIGDIAHIRMDDENGTNLRYQKIECLDRYTGSMNNVLQLESGRIVAPFSTIGKIAGSTFVSSVVYTDDDGLTFRASNDVAVVSDETHLESGAVEPVVAEVKPGTLLMFIRTVLGVLYYSVSYDGGAHWSASRPTRIVSSNAPCVPAPLKDGSFVLAWNNVQGQPMAGVHYSFARQCLHAAVTRDGFKTLQGARVIVRKGDRDNENAKYCYPLAAEASENEVFLSPFAVENADGCVWPDPQRYLLRLRPQDLTDAGVQDNFSEWMTDCPHEDSLRLSPGKDGLAWACGNFPCATKGSMTLTAEGDLPQNLRLLLSDCYIDRCTFAKSEEGEENVDYTALRPRAAGKWTLQWDETSLSFTDAAGTQTVPLKKKQGFNHLTLLYKGSETFTVTSFSMTAENTAWETGIEY